MKYFSGELILFLCAKEWITWASKSSKECLEVLFFSKWEGGMPGDHGGDEPRHIVWVGNVMTHGEVVTFPVG